MSNTDRRRSHDIPAENVETAAELVVLLDEHREPIGTADKQRVHGTDTPLHLAFSCYLFDDDGRLLVTRRALAKRAWPGVWTNSCCGHPGPEEEFAEAIPRRVRQELGMEITELRPVLPDFRYRAVDANGIVENEVCPVYVARVHTQPRQDESEVLEWRWADWDRFVALVDAAPWAVSPWAALQVPQLAAAL